MVYEIRFDKLKELEESMKKSSFATEMILKRAMDQSLTEITNVAKRNAPFKTGKLRRSIQPNHLGLLRGEVSANTPYAKYVEEGTRPHVIRPKNAKALAFRVGGKLVFARKVKHPGFKGRWYMKRTKGQTERTVIEFYRKASVQIAEVVRGKQTR